MLLDEEGDAMHLLLRGFTVLAAIGLCASIGLGTAAAQQRTDTIDYQLEPASATPRGWGIGNFYYYTNTSPTRVLAQWHFWDLNDGTTYVILVNGTTDTGAPFRGTCTFVAAAGGEAECTARFTGLASLTGSTVHQDGEGGPSALRMR
jgi:hypothetical protein